MPRNGFEAAIRPPRDPEPRGGLVASMAFMLLASFVVGFALAVAVM